jgi:hypothetical protein
MLALFSLVLAFGASSSAFGAATIVILNNDGAGEGFNDPTPAAPVGGNAGTTLGAQRLNAFQAAANIWGATLTSSVTIIIQANFNPLTCNATSAVLGSAGAAFIERDFAGAPFAATWYHEALAEKLTGIVLEPTHEINATFNSNLGQAGCLTGTFFYLGLDNLHGTNVDLVTVLLHEFGHGLGFQTFTSGTTGAQNSGFPSIYDRFLMDLSTGKSWLQMTNAERVTSALNTHKLAWDGPQVQTNVPSVLSLGTPFLQVNSPAGIAGSYDVGTASFGAALTAGGVTGNVIQALDPSDGAGALTTDGCTALTNAAAVLGNIAIIDRGTCGFVIKVKNAQDAGAIAVIIADNVAGSPPAGLGGTDPTITIPSVRVTLADGNMIKAQLGTGVNATLKLDTTVRAGADPFGKALMFSPNPFQGGSSVSHWDTSAFPNQLMEPAINGDLTHSVTSPSDLTFSQLSDVGWVATALPSSISQTSGDNQGTLLSQPFLIPISVTVSPAVAGLIVTWTANPSTGGANGTFPSTGRFATSTTDALGVATAPAFTANGQAGYYSMNATVPGAGTTTFALRNMFSPTAAPAMISGRITTPDGSPVAGVTMNLSGASSARAITDSQGNYRFRNIDTDNFYTVTPSLVNYHFGPESRSFSLLANMTDAVFTATRDTVISGNAIDTADFFVRQHYLDFLGREPDESGFNFWSDQILSCGSNAACVERRTINVSAAYFLSIEFQQTGGLVDGLYRASYGRRPMFAEFMPDTATVAQGVVVGDGDWAGQLAANKQAFIDAWVQRADFQSAYGGLTDESYVDTLISHTSASFNGNRDALVSSLSNGTMTRAAVLRQVVENDGFIQAKRNETFVMMQYFGYLRRDPDESGYLFWLNKLNQFGGNFEQAEMVKAFLVSGEYRERFLR